MKNLSENTLFKKLTDQFRRSPEQINKLLESDSELIRLENGKVLAVTTDCIVEEIETGLYDDPYRIGWMTVTVNMSDIAAVGARPIGILLQENLPFGYPDEKLKLLQKGINDACNAHGTFVIGGDTNRGKSFQMGGTAVGIINDDKIITRKGCNPGDRLFISGKPGIGNAFGFSKFFAEKHPVEVPYLPVANTQRGEIIRKFGSCCMDTSDGFFPAVSNLMFINEKGFELTSEFESFIAPEAIKIAEIFKLPTWIFIAGPHGEFELLFTIPEGNYAEFMKAAAAVKWTPVQLGQVIPEQKFLIQTDKNNRKIIDPFHISNLFEACEGKPDIYLTQLLKTNSEWKNQI